MVAAFLIFAMAFAALPYTFGLEAYAAFPSQKKVYKSIIAMKSKYPEGKKWTNNNTYRNGNMIGGGCVAFAMRMSDAAFGKEQPYTMHTNLDELRPGDIVRINNDTHSVIVLKVKKKSIVIAEGNFNRKIHWGRELPLSKLKKDKDLYILTRYYWKNQKAKVSDESVKLTWGKLTKKQRSNISGIAVFRNGEVVKRLKKTATSYKDTDIDSEYDIYFTYHLATYKKTAKKVKMYWNEKTGKWQSKKIKNAKTKKVKKTVYKYSHEGTGMDVDLYEDYGF